MESCPRLQALSFDLKLAIESVNLCDKIPNYITNHYQDNGEKFTSECEQINRLRQNAINCTLDENGLQYLKRYYCQLQLLRNRFPMLPDTECAVRFTWEDGYQKEDNTYNDIRFEETCILYNIGALYSKLGANETRRTHESMKNACTYFRYSAACFEKLRDHYTAYSLDLTPELLTCQVDILLAQAHEAVLEKSVLDQRPASVNAHIAVQISEYYQRALLNLSKPGMSSIVSKRSREWRVALTYKLSYYLSITYYCCGLIGEENKKRGEAVCYFENAVERLKDSWKNAEKISSDKTAIYKEAHTFTNDILTEKYKGIKRDNDSVYFDKVPALSSLPAVQGVIVAKSQAFDCHDPDVSGPDIFQKLVPLDTHLVASEYSEEKAKVLREVVQIIENKNRELETFLNCLELNRIPLNNEYLHLPRELLDCCANVVSRANMSKDLISAMLQLNNQHRNVTERIDALDQALQSFGENNASNRSHQDLQIKLKTIREMISQAHESNKELDQCTTTMNEHLKILNSPLEHLEKSLPIIAELNDEMNRPKFARLGLLKEKIETMKNQRKILLNDLRQKIQNDDITKLVLMRRQENHKDLFVEQIKKHGDLINIIKQNCAAQENILQSLTEANAEIADLRTKIATTFENRKRLIQVYLHSFKSFDEILMKVNKGIEFYQKQSTMLESIEERLATLRAQQQAKPAITSMTKPDIDLPAIPDRLRLKDYLAAMKPETWGSTKVEENIYKPSAMVNTDSNHSFYHPPIPPSAFPYSNIPKQNEQTFTSFNPQRTYQVQSPVHSEQPSLPFALQQPTPFTYQQPTYNQSHFAGQPPMHYNPPSAQSFPQQLYYPSQSFSTQQSPYPTPHSILQNSSMHQYQTISDPHRSIPQSLPPLLTKFDPYRPQPIGTYDIPKTFQTIRPPPPLLLNPQDVSRPGDLLGMNTAQLPSSAMNNNDSNQTQSVQYIPPSSSFANLSINSMSNQ